MPESHLLRTEQLPNGLQIKKRTEGSEKKNIILQTTEGHTDSLGDFYQFMPRFEWKASQAIPSIHESLNCPISLICALQEQKCVIC